MAFVSFADETSFAEVVIFPKLFETCYTILEKENVLLIKCQISTRGDELKLLASSVEIAPRDKEADAPDSQRTRVRTVEDILGDTDTKKTLYLRVTSRDDVRLRRALEILKKNPGDSEVAVFCTNDSKTFRLAGTGVLADAKLLDALFLLLGEDNVKVKEKK